MTTEALSKDAMDPASALQDGVWLEASELESAPAAESVKESALPLPPEKASDPFPVDEGEPATLIAGALKAVTVSATLVEADSVSPASVTETDSESEPE